MDAYDLMGKIADIEPAQTEPFSVISQEQGEQIARLFNGDHALFQQLDRLEGRKTIDGREWHFKLRQARNNCQRFFAILADPSLVPYGK